MSTVNMTTGQTTGDYSEGKRSFILSQSVDLGAAQTKKGSALAAADVINVVSIPAGFAVLGGGFQVTTAADSTTITASLGQGATSAQWVDTANLKTTGYAAQGTTGSTGSCVAYGSAGTVDLTIVALTGTLTKGVLRVWLEVADVSGNANGGSVTV